MIKFKGYSISESFIHSGHLIKADIGIFCAGWEQRFDHVIRTLELDIGLSIILNFEGDNLDMSVIHDTEKVLSSFSRKVVALTLPAANSRRDWNGALERLLEDQNIIKAKSLVVDYTCMPKSIVQTVFRGIVRKGLFSKSTWLYSLGVYSAEEKNIHFSQGVKEFFPIRHTPGDGGMSSKRVAIVALGGDEGLVIEYLEQYNFDRVFCIRGISKPSDNLSGGIERIIRRLSFENRVSTDDILSCDAASVVACIECMQAIINSLDEETSVEILCTGPKSHAVAACIIAERFASVRLMGRDAASYGRHNVQAEGSISSVEFIDYANPEARFVL